jgi:hypothetical protein
VRICVRTYVRPHVCVCVCVCVCARTSACACVGGGGGVISCMQCSELAIRVFPVLARFLALDFTRVTSTHSLTSYHAQMSQMSHRSQGGATRAVSDLFAKTSQNPVLLDTVAFLTSQWRVPSLPQLAPSSALLKVLWPRLQTYAITSPSDPLHAPCAAGADGDEVKAAECFTGWNKRKVGILSELNALRDELRAAFPATVAGVATSYSGSYWNEAGVLVEHSILRSLSILSVTNDF